MLQGLLKIQKLCYWEAEDINCNGWGCGLGDIAQELTVQEVAIAPVIEG